MGSKKSRKSEKKLELSTIVLMTLVLIFTLIFSVLLLYFNLTKDSDDISLSEQEKQEQERLMMERYQTGSDWISMPVTVGNGKSASVQFSAHYTLPIENGSLMAKQVVASAGTAKLTNEELQIWYLSEVKSYRNSDNAEQPDFSCPLENQLCPLSDDGLSWQHYFLERAVKNWQAQQIMLNASRQPQIIQEEAYKPNESSDLHGTYIAKDMPVNSFLYSDRPCFEPNEMHQAYLDGLEEKLGKLARERGFSSLADYMQRTYGKTVTAEMMVAAAKDFNTSYMYFTESSYGIELADEDVEQYCKTHSKELKNENGSTVDFRHILLIPAGSRMDGDGKVTAKEEAWDDCRKQAERLLSEWKSDYQTTRNAESNFGRYANAHSMDAGSVADGGYYQKIVKGQMISELDEWLFEKGREAGDVTILRSPVGYHIVYLCRVNKNSVTAAKDALMLERERKKWQEYGKGVKCSADYSKAALWVDTRSEGISLEDVLYPDVAHERYPSVMVFLQQDYMYHRYGGSYVGRGGCGITTMAMLTTYMADDLNTPAMMADRYGYYHNESGTDGNIFCYATADFGYYIAEITSEMGKITDALLNGQVVISLQRGGVFTSGGHYLLLQKYYEETDTFQVRDSNIYNYGRLPGHKVDEFSRGSLLSGNANCYIFQQKLRRIASCDRCGTEMKESEPELLLNEDYLCEKCSRALSRRNNFLLLSETFS